MLLISGGFDLSMGAVYALAGVIAAKYANDHGVAVGLIAGCLAGLAVGVINGIVVNVLRINAFVTTLATSIMIGGVSLAITGGLVISVHAESFSALGRDKIFGVEDTVWIVLVTVVVAAVLLHRTTFGRQIYAIGGNPEAARLCGIRVRLVSTLAFALCGLVAGIAGVLAASRISSGQAETGGYELIFDVFAAVVIGGTSIAGGVGAIWRTVVGLLLLAMIGNGFNLLAISDVYQRIAFGGLIILAVAIDIWTSQTRS